MTDDPTEWIEWADGISVTKADFDALTQDYRLFGNALVETIGDMRGRRIAPEKFFLRVTPGKRNPEQGAPKP